MYKQIVVKLCDCRGKDFRPEYVNVLDIHSTFSGTPQLYLSATLTEKVLADLKRLLNIYNDDIVVKSLPPDCSNIYLEVQHQTSCDVTKELGWMVDKLRLEKCAYRKSIIFTLHLLSCSILIIFVASHTCDILGQHSPVSCMARCCFPNL